jgi:hypothetical protein
MAWTLWSLGTTSCSQSFARNSSPQAALRYQHVAASRPGKIASAIEDLIAEAGEDAS